MNTGEHINEKHLLKINNENYLTQLRNQAYPADPTKVKPLFLFFMNRDCQDCWTHSKDWIRLSQIVQKQFTIAHTDCHFDNEVCQAFRLDNFPFILFFKDDKIYRYTGRLEIEHLLKYLSADNYLNSPHSHIFEENFRELLSVIDGSSDIINRLWRSASDLSKWCEENSKKWMKQIGLYYWSENAKMLVFALIVLGIPTVIATYFIMYIVIWT